MNTNQIERLNLFQGLDLFLEAFRTYIKSVLVEEYGESWADKFEESLLWEHKQEWKIREKRDASPENFIDFRHLKSFALNRQNKELLEKDFGGLVHSLPTWLGEINTARNPVAHFDNLHEKDERTKAWIHLRKIAQIIGRDDLVQQFAKLEINRDGTLPKEQILRRPKTRTASFVQYSTETLDIVNCAGLWQEVFAEEVYICPAEGGSYSHRQCKYFGAYFQKRVGAIGEIEAVVDVFSEDEAEIYWANGQQIEEYKSRAKQKAIELRPNEFPIRLFLLKDLYSTEFVKDSKGGMQAAKMYFDVESLYVSNVKELIEKLDGKTWSEFGL